ARLSRAFFLSGLRELAPPERLWHRTLRGVPRASMLASHSSPEIFMRRSLLLAGLTVVSLVASAAGAGAQSRMVQVGVLECRGGASVGFIVGSVTNLGCVLRVDGLPDDRYIATIRKVGLDLGITQESALAWAVYAPVARLGPGVLAGDYAGGRGGGTRAGGR